MSVLMKIGEAWTLFQIRGGIHTVFFLFLHKTCCGYSLEVPYICCGYSLEVPLWGTSNEYPQHMYSWRNKKTASTKSTYLELCIDNLYWLSNGKCAASHKKIVGNPEFSVNSLVKWGKLSFELIKPMKRGKQTSLVMNIVGVVFNFKVTVTTATANIQTSFFCFSKKIRLIFHANHLKYIYIYSWLSLSQPRLSWSYHLCRTDFQVPVIFTMYLLYFSLAYVKLLLCRHFVYLVHRFQSLNIFFYSFYY